MKKIMFNDKYGLTQAVLDGRKTMTRRVVPIKLINKFGHNKFSDKSYELIQYAQYKVGEIVAVAQSYKDCGLKETYRCVYGEYATGERASKGWGNKMYVKAELMLHHIRITNIRVERLQDISDEDCISEGVLFYNNRYWTQGLKRGCTSEIPQVPFRYMIDKISGKGTWNSNPYVFVYEFELVD